MVGSSIVSLYALRSVGLRMECRGREKQQTDGLVSQDFRSSLRACATLCSSGLLQEWMEQEMIHAF